MSSSPPRGPLPLVPSASGGTNYEQPVDDTLSLSDALNFERGLVIAESSLALSDALVFERELVLGDTVSFSDLLTFDRELVLTEPIPVSDAVALGIEMLIQESALALSDEVVLETGKGVTIDDVLGIADALSFDREMVLAESVGVADALAFEREIHIADTLPLADFIDPLLEGVVTTVRKWRANRFGIF